MQNVEIYRNKKISNEIINKDDNPYIKKNNTEKDSNKREKRKSFRELIQNKYTINNDRLYYKYERCKGKILEKKIPFNIELPYIFLNAHVLKSLHYSVRKSKENILSSDYYYEGITKDLVDFIKNCPKCKAENSLTPVKKPMKLNIENGPHSKIQMDIWYLNDDISKACGYKYVLDIIDVFSKWMFSYPLLHKSAEEILICLRKYIISFGRFNKLQTDNGLEFKNMIINNFCIENSIERLYSPPYQPQANGCVESVHKIVQKFINNNFYTYGSENFSIESSIVDAIEYHNYSKHSSTNFTPYELKDTDNVDLIQIVNENIKKNVGKKIVKNNELLLEMNDKLLIYNNIYLNEKTNEIKILKNKKLGKYCIPAIFNGYNNQNKLIIEVKKDFKNELKSNEIYTVEYNLVRLVCEEGFNYYLESD